MNKHLKGTLYGAIASSSYGTNPLFGLPLFSAGIGVNSVLFYRYFFATLIFYFWLKYVRKKSLKISLKEFFPLVLVSLFFSLSSLTLFQAFHYIEAGIACTILFIYPIIVAVIMAVFFKEKVTPQTVLAIILTSIGIVLLYKGDGVSLNAAGVGIVLLSALLYALYIVCVKKIKSIRTMPTEKLAFYVIFFGMFVYVVNLKFCTQLQLLDKPLLWVFALSLAFFPTILSIETINIAIKLIGSTKTAILGALEPLTAIFFGVIFFHEHLTFRIVMGVIAILIGVLSIVVNKKQSKCNN